MAEMLARISAAELTDWMAYEVIAGPLGAARGDLHAGIISATIANANSGKRGKKFKPADFIPQWDRPRAHTPHAMANYLRSLTLKMGGKIRRRGDG